MRVSRGWRRSVACAACLLAAASAGACTGTHPGAGDFGEKSPRSGAGAAASTSTKPDAYGRCLGADLTPARVTRIVRRTYATERSAPGATNLRALRARVQRWRATEVLWSDECRAALVNVVWSSEIIPGRHRQTVLADLAPVDGRWRVTGLSVAPDHPLPLWAGDRLSVERDGRSTVAITVGRAHPPRLLARASRARSEVRHVIGGPPAHERFIVAVMDDSDSMAGLTGSSGAVRDPWGVTITTDGRADSPPVVVIRADVEASVPEFDYLLRHEAVHALTWASGAQVPTWMVEGYADLIAARAGQEPEAFMVGRLDGWRGGFALPRDRDFAAASTRTRAYERSYLALRTIDDRGGRRGAHTFTRVVAAESRRVGRRVAIRRGLRAVGLTAPEFRRAYSEAMTEATR